MQFSFRTLLSTRTGKAMGVAAMGLLVNLVLGVVKILAGWQSGSMAVMGDGFNNISDMGSVLLLIMTFYFAARPSDRSHPFGYGRLEYVNSTVMAAVVLYVGITLFIDSAEKVLHPEATDFSILVAGILLFGMVGKLFLAWWYDRAAWKLDSQSFKAYSADSLSDLVSTAGVLVAGTAEYFTGIRIDGWVGALMSLVIMWTGLKILRGAVNSLLGSAPDGALYKKIRETILSCPGVYGVHDLIVHDYGPGNHFASAHVELDSQLSLVKSHEISENVMTVLREKMGVQSVIHADPKAISNPREKEYRRDLESAIYRSGLPLSYHDFFVEEKGKDVNFSFEVKLTGACHLPDEEIYRVLLAELQKANPHYHIEKAMVDRNFLSGRVYGDSREEMIDEAMVKGVETKAEAREEEPRAEAVSKES